MKELERLPVSHFRDLFAMLFRSKVAESNTNELTEHELIEALTIVEDICIHRLEGSPREWKGDRKRKYKYLFKSIKTECTEAIRYHFSVDDKPARGVSITKFNTLILDSIFEILQEAGPKLSRTIITILREYAEEELRQMPFVHVDDATVARVTLDKLSKDRAVARRAPKKQTLEDRLEMIDMVVENFQPA